MSETNLGLRQVGCSRCVTARTNDGERHRTVQATAVLWKRTNWPQKRISKYYENAWNKVHKNARKTSTKTHKFKI